MKWTRELGTRLRGTRAGATLIATILAAMGLGGLSAVAIDYRWFGDQRDTIQGAVEAAAISVGRDSNPKQLETGRQPLTDADFEKRVEALVKTHLGHLSPDRRAEALNTLSVAIGKNPSGRTVRVNADLGGALLAQHFIKGQDGASTETYGWSGGKCSNLTIEFVFALDITGSMMQNIPGTPTQTRIEAAVDTAKQLVTDILSACPDADLRIGIVPWAAAVRLPNTANAKTWTNMGVYTNQQYNPYNNESWAGCLETRQSDSAKTESALYKSITGFGVPSASSKAMPFYSRDMGELSGRLTERTTEAYADTLKLLMAREGENIDMAAAKALIRSKWTKRAPKSGVAYNKNVHRHPSIGPRARNLWGENVPGTQHKGGPNFGCPHIAMLPITKETVKIDATFDAIRNSVESNLTKIGTQMYLGTLWAARMLDPRWHHIWKGQAPSYHAPKAPGYPDNHTRAIILLTDGMNMNHDRWNTMPGVTGLRVVEVNEDPQDANSNMIWTWETCSGTDCIGRGEYKFSSLTKKYPGGWPSYGSDRKSLPYWLSDYTSLGRFGTMAKHGGNRKMTSVVMGQWSVRNALWANVYGPWTTGANGKGMLDELLLETCRYAREDVPRFDPSEPKGIDIYAVTLHTKLRRHTYNLLRKCTGDAKLNTDPADDERTFEVSNRQQLSDAFSDIARGLTTIQRQ